MKKISSLFVVFCLFTLIYSLPGCSKKKKQIKEFVLKEDLSIGVESGDERYMFAEIGSIGLDSKENIYVLDGKDSRIKKFDKEGNFLKSLEVKKGQGPEEVSYLHGMVVTEKGKIYALDRNSSKILVFDENCNFLRFFRMEFGPIHIIPHTEDEIIVLGLKDDKILHVLNQEGELLDSFGEPFPIPSKHLQYKNMPLTKLPRRADRSRSGKIFLVNIHKYEIRVYEGREVKHTIEHESEFFYPFEVVRSVKDDSGAIMIGMRFPYVPVIEHENRLYITLSAREADDPKHLNIFENGRCIASVEVVGYAFAADRKGRLYFAEEEEFPKVVRYKVESK